MSSPKQNSSEHNAFGQDALSQSDSGPVFRLIDLEPEQVRALPPQQREEWKRQNEQENEDLHRLVEFVTALYPLCRKFYKAERAGLYFNDWTRNGPAKWEKLLDLLFSLPSYAEDDPGWFERVRRSHECNKALRLRRLTEKEAAQAALAAVAESPRPAESAADTPCGETLCPHCGHPTDPDSVRCSVCRRYLED